MHSAILVEGGGNGKQSHGSRAWIVLAVTRRVLRGNGSLFTIGKQRLNRMQNRDSRAGRVVSRFVGSEDFVVGEGGF